MIPIMSDGTRFELGEAVCILCTPLVKRRGIMSRAISMRDKEVHDQEITGVPFGRSTRSVLDTASPHWDAEQKTFSKQGKHTSFPMPTIEPKSLGYDTPAKKKPKISREHDELVIQLENWLGTRLDLEEHSPTAPPSWEQKYK